MERICKPDSVPPAFAGGGDHLSLRPTRKLGRAVLRRFPIWSCSAQSLP